MKTAAWEVVKMQRERLEEWQRMMDTKWLPKSQE